MVGESTHLQVIPQKNTQNVANLPLQTCDNIQWTFFVVRHERNNFANLGSFAKVSVPLQFTIPWFYKILNELVLLCARLSPASQPQQLIKCDLSTEY